MNKTAVVWTCAHADPSVSNERFAWLGNLIYDIRPDFCVDLGDGADLRSLNTFDTSRPSSIVTQNYEADIDSYLESQEMIRDKFKKNKKKRPKWYGLEGNHEHRIKKALSHDPRLQGSRYGISFKHLQTDQHFDKYWEYENSAPAIANISGVDYAHFIGSGNYGTAMSGEHHAYNLLKKRMRSTTVGHSHKRNIYFRDDAKAIGLVAGCFKGKPEHWAGQANAEWASGVWIMRNMNEYGFYEPQWVSLETLKKEYA